MHDMLTKVDPLREKPIFDSKAKEIKKNKFLKLFRFLFIFGFLAISILGITLLKNLRQADAQVAVFYPTTCLGGWQNVSNAEGAPDVTQDNDENYGRDNSASIYNASGQIYCGGFEGNIPVDALNKKVMVKFSWATSTLDAAITEPNASSGEENVKPEQEGQVEQTEPEIIPEEEITEPEVSPEEEIIPESEPVEESVPAEEPALDSTSLPQAEPETLPEPAPEETSVFFSIPIAYAEELDTNTEEREIESSEEEPQPETQPEILSDTPPGTILEVLYTLDDTTWNNLAYIETIDDDGSFELPAEIFTTTENLKEVQIALHTVSSYDSQQIIYLDSVWLEVEYEQINGEGAEDPSQVATALESVENEEQNLEEEQQDEEMLEDKAVEETPEAVAEEVLLKEIIEEEIIELIPNPVELPPPQPWPILSKRQFTKKITLDPSATHSCEVRPFTMDISGVDIAIVPVFLTRNPESAYKMEIGGLPDGVDITFAKSRYTYNPGPGETEVDLKIINEDGSRKGDFSVMIYFTKLGTDSSSVCQMHVVNK